MSQNGPFGIDPEDFDRVLREAGDGLRDALDRLGKASGLGHAARRVHAGDAPEGRTRDHRRDR